jgi:hypothetical protein
MPRLIDFGVLSGSLAKAEPPVKRRHGHAMRRLRRNALNPSWRFRLPAVHPQLPRALKQRTLNSPQVDGGRERI